MDRTVRFEFLNAPESNEQPSIWLDILEKGVNLKFTPPRDQFAGVPRPTAVLVGNLVGVSVVGLMIFYVENSPIPIILSYLLGICVILPGTYAIKAYRLIRNWFVG